MVLKKDNVERIAVDSAQIAKWQALGYTEIGGQEPRAKNETKDLKALKLEDLKGLAKEKGIDGYSSLNKEELIAVLKDVI